MMAHLSQDLNVLDADHPDEPTLWRYCRGLGTQAFIAAVDQHVEACQSCFATVVAMVRRDSPGHSWDGTGR